MNRAGLVWANLRRRPAQGYLTLAAVTIAFILYGMALGIAECIRRSALEHHIDVPSTLLPGAIGISAVGMALTLLLTSNAMAHVVRARVHELAVLSAIGFSHRRILALLVAEAAVPCVSGAALGLLGAKGMFAGLASALPVLALVPAPVYTAPIVVVAFALALVVATLGTIIPVMRIARMDVAVLMRGRLPAPAVPKAAHVAGASLPESRSSSAPETRHSVITDLLLLRQIAVSTRIGISTLPSRLRGALLIVASVGGVVFLLLAPLSTAEGIRLGMLRSGDPARVVLRSTSAILLDESHIPDDITALIADAPGMARSEDGSPLLDSEVFTWPTGLVERNSGSSGYSMLVGVGPLWREMTPTLRLLSGRLPRPGSRELIAGEYAAQKFSSLDAGTAQYGGVPWRIVGTFSTGSWWDGYLVGPAADVRPLPSRSKGSALRVRLSSAGAFNTFQDFVAGRLPPTIVVERETDYYRGLWRRVPKHLAYMAFVLAGLISAGAALGTTLVMHNALDDRRREIATLRLLGFDARAIAASVLIEGLGLTALGSLVGVALAWWCLDGRLVNGAWNVFRITVDLQMLCLAVGWGAGIAFAGTFPLVLRTLRQSALDAIHDLFVALQDGIRTTGERYARRYRAQSGPTATLHGA